MTDIQPHDPSQLSADDVLIERLRALEWPRPRPELKERCWRELERKLDGRPPAFEPIDGERSLDYSCLKAPTAGLVPAARMAAARGLSRPRMLVPV